MKKYYKLPKNSNEFVIYRRLGLKPGQTLTDPDLSYFLQGQFWSDTLCGYGTLDQATVYTREQAERQLQPWGNEWIPLKEAQAL